MARIKPCVTAVVGGYWGDEGKGRVASYEAQDARLVLRTTGGNNAGHTVYYKGEKLPLHLIPGAIIYPQATAVICSGVVVNPQVLIEEIKMLSHYVDITPEKFILSDRAHIIMPFHISLDNFQETKRGSNKIGTTKRGIGPCYEDIAARISIRFQDLFTSEEKLLKKIQLLLDFHADSLNSSTKEFSLNYLHNYCLKAKKELGKYIQNPDKLISQTLTSGEKIVIEGAQADHLDLIHGDYPNCTSSQCNPAGTLSGAGIGPKYVDKVIVVMKAYCSRVGNGPFPTELDGEDAEVIRRIGHEYGTTTGRPRRCGWLDLAALNPLRGYTDICLNHLDTIGRIGKELGVIKVCMGYFYGGHFTNTFPSDIETSKKEIYPLYREFFGGWDISKNCQSFEDLPDKAQEFVDFIEMQTGIPVTYIGIGPNNEDTIVRPYHNA